MQALNPMQNKNQCENYLNSFEYLIYGNFILLPFPKLLFFYSLISSLAMKFDSSKSPLRFARIRPYNNFTYV